LASCEPRNREAGWDFPGRPASCAALRGRRIDERGLRGMIARVRPDSLGKAVQKYHVEIERLLTSGQNNARNIVSLLTARRWEDE